MKQSVLESQGYQEYLEDVSEEEAAKMEIETMQQADEEEYQEAFYQLYEKEDIEFEEDFLDETDWDDWTW